jgi:hypothetical protein
MCKEIVCWDHQFLLTIYDLKKLKKLSDEEWKKISIGDEY